MHQCRSQTRERLRWTTCRTRVATPHSGWAGTGDTAVGRRLADSRAVAERLPRSNAQQGTIYTTRTTWNAGIRRKRAASTASGGATTLIGWRAAVSNGCLSLGKSHWRRKMFQCHRTSHLVDPKLLQCVCPLRCLWWIAPSPQALSCWRIRHHASPGYCACNERCSVQYATRAAPPPSSDAAVESDCMHEHGLCASPCSSAQWVHTCWASPACLEVTASVGTWVRPCARSVRSPPKCHAHCACCHGACWTARIGSRAQYTVRRPWHSAWVRLLRAEACE